MLKRIVCIALFFIFVEAFFSSSNYVQASAYEIYTNSILTSDVRREDSEDDIIVSYTIKFLTNTQAKAEPKNRYPLNMPEEYRAYYDSASQYSDLVIYFFDDTSSINNICEDILYKKVTSIKGDTDLTTADRLDFAFSDINRIKKTEEILPDKYVILIGSLDDVAMDEAAIKTALEINELNSMANEIHIIGVGTNVTQNYVNSISDQIMVSGISVSADETDGFHNIDSEISYILNCEEIELKFRNYYSKTGELTGSVLYRDSEFYQSYDFNIDISEYLENEQKEAVLLDNTTKTLTMNEIIIAEIKEALASNTGRILICMGFATCGVFLLVFFGIRRLILKSKRI